MYMVLFLMSCTDVTPSDITVPGESANTSDSSYEQNSNDTNQESSHNLSVTNDPQSINSNTSSSTRSMSSNEKNVSSASSESGESDSGLSSSSQLGVSSHSVVSSSSTIVVEDEKKASYLFESDVIRKYQILIDKADLEFLDAQPTREEYVEAKLVFEGDTIQPVGVRYKGSVGGWIGCIKVFENFDGPKIDGGKCSVKLKFNWKGNSGRFYGLRKLQFHTLSLDGTKLHDKLGYHLFRKFDIPAPRASHAELYFNDTYMGLYGNVEQIDKEFVERHFPNDSEGNLFKETWPLTSAGDVMPEEYLVKGLKTNEDSPDVSSMLEFTTQFSRAKSREDRKDILSRYASIDKMLRYIVVDRAIANDDGAMKWFCHNGIAELCYPHNYFWYQEPTSKKLHLIPWDLDHSFSSVNVNNLHNQFTWVQDDWNEVTDDCDVFPGTGGSAPQRSAACDNIFKTMTYYEDEYNVLQKEFYQTYMNEEYIIDKIDTWAAVLDPAIKKEVTEFVGDESFYDKWKEEIEVFKSDIIASFDLRGPK